MNLTILLSTSQLKNSLVVSDLSIRACKGFIELATGGKDEKNGNVIIQRQKYENHEIHKIQRQNHNNYENLFIPYKKHENHEIPIIHIQNQEIYGNLIMPSQNNENH